MTGRTFSVLHPDRCVETYMADATEIAFLELSVSFIRTDVLKLMFLYVTLDEIALSVSFIRTDVLKPLSDGVPGVWFPFQCPSSGPMC